MGLYMSLFITESGLCHEEGEEGRKNVRSIRRQDPMPLDGVRSTELNPQLGFH